MSAFSFLLRGWGTGVIDTEALGSIDASGTLDVGGAANLGDTLDVAGVVTAPTVKLAGAGFLGLGSPEAVTIASGVATVTRPYVVLDAEGAGTTDTLDSVTYTGAVNGDLLLLCTTATDTITADNSSTLHLGAGTRAIAPGGSLLLQLRGNTVWTEISFLAATS